MDHCLVCMRMRHIIAGGRCAGCMDMRTERDMRASDDDVEDNLYREDDKVKRTEKEFGDA